MLSLTTEYVADGHRQVVMAEGIPSRDGPGLHGTGCSTTRSKAGGSASARPEGGELLAAVALHGPHRAIYHAVMP